MKRTLILFFALSFITISSSFAKAQTIKIAENKEKKQLDVTVDGELFTSYLYWDDQKKPILHPLKTSKGTVVTRNFPLIKVAGERTDHPHHISMWFNYGNSGTTAAALAAKRWERSSTRPSTPSRTARDRRAST
jgi:hypothetical protein